MEALIDRIATPNSSTTQIVWRIKGKGSTNGWKTFKFSIKQRGFYITDDDLFAIFINLKGLLEAQVSPQECHLSLYSKPYEQVSLFDIQYAPGYATFVALLLVVLGIVVKWIQQKRITKSTQDVVSLIMLLTVILWMVNTILLTGDPSEMSCMISYLYLLILVSLHTG
jgi:uncharacterized membrane protein